VVRAIAQRDLVGTARVGQVGSLGEVKRHDERQPRGHDRIELTELKTARDAPTGPARFVEQVLAVEHGVLITAFDDERQGTGA
jgi:hypothetical protein